MLVGPGEGSPHGSSHPGVTVGPTCARHPCGHNGGMDLHLSRPQGETPERHDPAHPTPAALVAGQVPATDALHPLSAFDMFRIGIGPSSSHTVGPMRAGLAFAAELAALEPRGVSRVGIDLLGSLGATGRGHNTDRAVLLGLAGHDPATVPTAVVESVLPEVARTGGLTLVGGHRVPFDVDRDIRFLPRTRLPYHVNALTITAWPDPPRTSPAEAPSSGPLPPTDAAGSPPLLRRTYYSVGGGFVMVQTNDDPEEPVVESLATAEATSTLGVAAPTPSPPPPNSWNAAPEAGCPSRRSCAPMRSPCGLRSGSTPTWTSSRTRCSPASRRASPPRGSCPGAWTCPGGPMRSPTS